MLRRLPASLGIALLVAAAGCSGAEESDLFGPEASVGATEPSAPAAANEGATAPGDPAPSSSPSETDEPAPPASPDPGAPGTPKPACAAESLDNDTFRSADVFDACIAGKLSGRDVDFVAIVAPPDAKQIHIEHAESGGKVSYRVYVSGFSATFTDTPPDELPAIPNARYTFKVEPSGTIGDRDWELAVTFQ